jgi:hypothetical protein
VLKVATLFLGCGKIKKKKKAPSSLSPLLLPRPSACVLENGKGERGRQDEMEEREEREEGVSWGREGEWGLGVL